MVLACLCSSIYSCFTPLQPVSAYNTHEWVIVFVLYGYITRKGCQRLFWGTLAAAAIKGYGQTSLTFDSRKCRASTIALFLRGVLVLDIIQNQIHMLMTFVLSIWVTETLGLATSKSIRHESPPSAWFGWPPELNVPLMSAAAPSQPKSWFYFSFKHHFECLEKNI